MLTYPMEERGSLPLYEYLCRSIRSDILSGALPAGTRLPSKRALAEHLRVSVITVEGAYSQLEAEGYLQARPKRGFFVSAVERPLPARRGAARRCSPGAAVAAGAAGFEPQPGWIPHASPFPHGQSSPGRCSPRRRRLCCPLFPTRDFPLCGKPLPMNCVTSRVWQSLRPRSLSAPAPEYLYLLLAQLLGRDTAFAVEDPGYPKIRQVYRACGAACVPIPLDGQGIDPAALAASGAGALHISPNHQYPTGLVTPIARRQALLRWAEDTGGTIIEDDYDSEFRFTGRPIPTLQSIDARGRVVYLNTFSQTISPSMRLGFLVLPPRLLERYRRNLGFYACTVPALEQHVLARFISGGHYERHLARMRKEYRERRGAVLEAFRLSPLSQRVTFSEEGAGLHFLLTLDTARSDDELRRLTSAAGLRLSFLSEYADRPDSVPAHTLVVNYAGLSQPHLPEAVHLLETVLLPLL